MSSNFSSVIELPHALRDRNNPNKKARMAIISGNVNFRGSWIGLFYLRLPIYGGFVYLTFPRWASGVNAHSSGTPLGCYILNTAGIGF